jgi:hypothetical protein
MEMKKVEGNEGEGIIKVVKNKRKRVRWERKKEEEE